MLVFSQPWLISALCEVRNVLRKKSKSGFCDINTITQGEHLLVEIGNGQTVSLRINLQTQLKNH